MLHYICKNNFYDHYKEKINRDILDFIFTFCRSFFWRIFNWRRLLLYGIALQRYFFCARIRPHVINRFFLIYKPHIVGLVGFINVPLGNNNYNLVTKGVS
jgi:hypothetical protein